jgi:hypothetical protein
MEKYIQICILGWGLRDSSAMIRLSCFNYSSHEQDFDLTNISSVLYIDGRFKYHDNGPLNFLTGSLELLFT